MKSFKFILLVLLIIASGCAVDPSDGYRVNNVELAREVALEIAQVSRNTVPYNDGHTILTDHQTNGFAGYAILNGETNFDIIPPSYSIALDDILIDFHEYLEDEYGAITVTDGTLLFNCDESGGVVTIIYDVAGTVEISGTVNGVAVEDTVTLDFLWINGFFQAGSTLVNGAGTGFDLPE